VQASQGFSTQRVETFKQLDSILLSSEIMMGDYAAFAKPSLANCNMARKY
jgi:hypothetical protein